MTAAYELTADIMTVGGNGKLYVKTADGKAPGRVQIYAVADGQEDTLIGTTNAAGVLVTNRFCQTAGEKFTVYAKGEAGLSFRCSGVTNGIGSTEVAPTNIRLNAVQAPATTQNISWFAAPDYTARNGRRAVTRRRKPTFPETTALPPHRARARSVRSRTAIRPRWSTPSH